MIQNIQFKNIIKRSSLFASFVALTITQSALAADLDQKAFDKAMDSYLSSDSNVEKLGNSIQAYFTKKRLEEQKNAAQAEANQMEEQFKNPTKIDIGNSPVKGPKDAKVTVVAFSDFQCPYCSKGKTIVDELVKMYPKDVKIVFKNLPLEFHPQAKPAAIAAMAAGRQGKFWEMHDFLFENQKSLADGFYPEAAKAIGLDMAKFQKDSADPAIATSVEKDLELGKSLGVQGTPNFFINGVNLKGAYPVEEFKKIIDKWLSMK